VRLDLVAGLHLLGIVSRTNTVALLAHRRLLSVTTAHRQSDWSLDGAAGRNLPSS
jgi:hypothetical protein